MQKYNSFELVPGLTHLFIENRNLLMVVYELMVFVTHVITYYAFEKKSMYITLNSINTTSLQK